MTRGGGQCYVIKRCRKRSPRKLHLGRGPKSYCHDPLRRWISRIMPSKDEYLVQFLQKIRWLSSDSRWPFEIVVKPWLDDSWNSNKGLGIGSLRGSLQLISWHPSQHEIEFCKDPFNRLESFPIVKAPMRWTKDILVIPTDTFGQNNISPKARPPFSFGEQTNFQLTRWNFFLSSLP